MRIGIASALLCGIGMFAVAPAATASPTFFQDPPTTEQTFGLSFARPKLDESGLGLMAGAYDVYGTIALKSQWSLLFDLPFSRYSVDGFDTESGVGNPFIGAQYSSSPKTAYQVGLYLPLIGAEDFAAHGINMLVHPEQFQRFAPETFSLYASRICRSSHEEGLFWGSEVSFVMMISTDDDDSDDTEVELPYGFAIGYQAADFEGRFGLVGAWWVTDSEDDFVDRFVNSIQLQGGSSFGEWHPSVFIRFPLRDEFQEFMDFHLGLQVEFRR
jgi:hypothetical protein